MKPKTKRQIKLERLKRTAYHEAGHAVISYILGIPPHSVTILGKGNTAGSCRSYLCREVCKDDLIMLALSGSFAEYMCPGFTLERKNMLEVILGAQDDLKQVVELVGEDGFQKAFDENTQIIIEHLAFYRKAVNALAKALLEWKTIIGKDEIVGIIEGAGVQD